MPPRGPRVIDRPRPGVVRLIDENGEQLGILEVSEALRIAEERSLDLVEMAATARPPTCKLMDFGKFKYEQKKKIHGQKKPMLRRKEIKLRPKIEENDFNVKVNHARNFLQKGHKVLVTMIFRGREMMHVDLGKELLVRFAKTLEDCARVEKEPSKEGRNRMDMLLAPK
ncbi:MAG: translation initiation factor IF-3 [Planctomycetota bacterium]